MLDIVKIITQVKYDLGLTFGLFYCM